MRRLVFLGLLMFLFQGVSAKKPYKGKTSKPERIYREFVQGLKGSEKLKSFNAAIFRATSLGLYEQGDSLCIAASELLKAEKDSIIFFEHYRVKGRLYTILKRYTQAHDLFSASLNYHRRQGNWQEEAQVLLNLIEYYRASTLYEQANLILNYIGSHLQFDSLSNYLKAAYFHRSAAVLNEWKRDLEGVVLLSKKSLEYSEPDSLLEAMGTSYLEMGYAYAQLKDERCRLSFENAFDVFEFLERRHDMCITLLNIASYYIRVEENQKAIFYIDSVEQTAKGYFLPGLRYLMLEKKSKAYFEMGRFQEAYLLNDSAGSFFRQEAEKRFSDEMATQSQRFQTEEALLRVKAMESENEKVLAKAKSQEIGQRFFLILSAVSLIVVLGLFYFISQLRRNKGHLEESQQALSVSNDDLMVALKEKDGLLEEVHHRVKNNLQLITSLIRVQQFQAQDHMSDESKAMVNDILDRVGAMAIIHEKLYSQQQISSLRADEYFSVLVSELKTLGGSFSRPLDIRVQAPGVELSVSGGIALGMILSELISNSLKHAFVMQDAPRIKINIAKEKIGDKFRVRFSYEDNGIGYPSENKMGMGNRLVLLFSRQLEGKHMIDSKNRFYFELEYWEG